MLVWRVENEKGAGPYINGFCQGYWGESLYDSLRHPPPSGNAALSPHKYIFGFRDCKELKEWFSQIVLDDMKQAGYNVVCYIVPDDSVVDCDMHIAFLKATKGKSIRISKF